MVAETGRRMQGSKGSFPEGSETRQAQAHPGRCRRSHSGTPSTVVSAPWAVGRGQRLKESLSSSFRRTRRREAPRSRAFPAATEAAKELLLHARGDRSRPRSGRGGQLGASVLPQGTQGRPGVPLASVKQGPSFLEQTTAISSLLLSISDNFYSKDK